MKVKLYLPSAAKIIRTKGLGADGAVQMFHTQNVLRRIKKYMPFRSGAMYKITVAQTDIRKPEIVTESPGAMYLFIGKVMIDPQINAAGFLTPEGWRSRKGCVKVRTNRDLVYFRGKNPQAGPRWDRALSANEGKVMATELQHYIDRRSGGK